METCRFFTKKPKSSFRKMTTICYQNNGLNSFRSGTSWNIAQISNFPFIVGSGSKTLRFFGKGILVIGVTGSGIIAGGSFGSAVPAAGILRAYFSRRLSATKRPVERVMNHVCMAY
jgi:hypothetical protein